VKIVKEGLKKASKGSLEMQISRFLFHYHLTQHTTTGVAPAELILGRRPRSHLDLVKPDLRQQVQSKQMVQLTKSGGRREKNFEVGSDVLVKNFGSGKRWLTGTIVRSCGPKSYKIKLNDGRIIRRHVNHIRPRTADFPSDTEVDSDDWTDSLPVGTAQPAEQPTPFEGPIPLVEHSATMTVTMFNSQCSSMDMSKQLKGKEVWYLKLD